MNNQQDFLATREGRIEIADAIERHLDTHGIARKDLIRPNLSKGTIDKVFQGEFSDRTLTKIEAILKTSFSPKNSEKNGHQDLNQAEKKYGGYTFQAVEDLQLQGSYLCIRPMFAGNSNLNAYVIDVEWNKQERCLRFVERSRRDSRYVQNGTVYMPFGIPFLNFVSTDFGSLRLIQVSLPDHEGVCRGIISTLSNPKGSLFTPVAAPIVLRKLAKDEQPELGYISSEQDSYELYVKELMVVATEEYGLFVPPPQAPVERRRAISVVKQA